MKSAIFLDRDGVINKDTGYPSEVGDLELTPQIVPFLKCARALKYDIVVISNQSGIAKGKFTKERVDEINLAICKMVKGLIEPADFLICPHSSKDACVCRKPEPGLFYKAIIERNIDPYSSIVIGNKPTDIGAASKVRVRYRFLLDPATEKVRFLMRNGRTMKCSKFDQIVSITLRLRAMWQLRKGTTFGPWLKENPCGCSTTWFWVPPESKMQDHCICKEDYSLGPNGEYIYLPD